MSKPPEFIEFTSARVHGIVRLSEIIEMYSVGSTFDSPPYIQFVLRGDQERRDGSTDSNRRYYFNDHAARDKAYKIIRDAIDVSFTIIKV